MSHDMKNFDDIGDWNELTAISHKTIYSNFLDIMIVAFRKNFCLAN